MVLAPTSITRLTHRVSRHPRFHHVAHYRSSAFAQVPRSRVAFSHRRRLSSKTPPAETPPAASPPPVTPTADAAADLSDRELLRRLVMRRTPQRLYWWLGGVVFIGATLVAFGPELKLGVSKHTADVATKSLQDETLQSHTRELASQIVQTVLNDPKVLDQASRFIQRLVVMESTREALRGLTVHTLNDPSTLATVSRLAKSLVPLLLEDPRTREQVVDFVRQTLQDSKTRAALLKLLDDLLHDPSMQRNVAQLLAQTFGMDPVKRSVASTIGESVHDVLSRPDIQTHAKQFVGSVVQDQTVQAQSGDAIWGTVMYAITPTWLSWIWEKNEHEEAQAAEAAATAVTETVANAVEADVALAKSGETLAEYVEDHAVEVVMPEVNTTPAPLEQEASSQLVETPAPSRFEMLRRLTRHLPLVGGASAAEKEKEQEEERQRQWQAANEAERVKAKEKFNEAEHHLKGTGSGFL